MNEPIKQASSTIISVQLSEELCRCESAEEQLDLILEELRQRHSPGQQISVPACLRAAPLVAQDPQTRRRLIDQEFRYRSRFSSQHDVDELVARYPEFMATIQSPGEQPDQYDTIHDEASDQHPTPPVSRSTVNQPTEQAIKDSGPASKVCHPHVQSEPDTIGQSFGRYRVREMVGRGGFASVYLADDSQLDRQVAIKSLHKGQFESDTQAKNFIQEAKATARLNHPSIVTLYDVSTADDGSMFAVMEYVDGQSLAERMDAGDMDLASGIEILVRVAQTLGYAHRQGFVHRDVKPGNILLDKEGRPRVADFGLAVHEEVQRKHAGELAGTPAYMAPEQVLGQTHRLDGRTDVWSLGVILYQMLTGRLPFHGNNMDEVFDEILNRDARPTRQLDSSIPPELDKVCRKCLARDMQRRYASAEDLAIALDRCLPSVTPVGEVSIASNPALVIAGLGLIGVGFCLSFVGAFFVWVSIMGMQWAFGGLASSTEFIWGIGTFSVLSSPLFLGLPTMILGLWLAVVQGLRWRGRIRYTSGKAVAALALASLTPLLNLIAAIPAVLYARGAFAEVRLNYPRVKGRGLALIAVALACCGTVLSTWLAGKAIYVHSAYQAADRGGLALQQGRLDDAIFESRLATSKYPFMAVGWKLNGEAFLATERHREAITSLSEAINLYGGYVRSMNLDSARYNTGNHNNIFRLSQCYARRAEAYRAVGNVQLAEEDSERAEYYVGFTEGKILAISQLRTGT